MSGDASVYDAFSADYDRFVDWESRLAAEMPFIERQLQAADVHRVLDAACGTGMHAIALAEGGYEVVGTDLSAGMIGRARDNSANGGLCLARADGANLSFEVAGFGELSTRVGNDFDALLCLGNSLPHVLTPDDLTATLNDFAACLRPGGLLLIQNRNFDAVLADRDRWMGPQTYRDRRAEWLFLRFYDFEPDGLLTFNVVTLRREAATDWKQQITSTRLWPVTQSELAGALTAAGFEAITYFGNLQGVPFDAGNSPNLVLTARRRFQLEESEE